jgi:hypothetical protein
MATTTITTTAGEDTRLQAAFGAYLSLPGNANAAQIKGAVVTFMKQIVRQYEAEQLARTVGADIAPT